MNPEIELKILKSSDWPKEKHPYFQRFSYKKMILMEHFKMFFLKLVPFFLIFQKHIS